MTLTAQSEVGRIRRLLLKHPTAAFIDQARVDSNWQPLNYLERVDYSKALAEYDAFVTLFTDHGCEIEFLPTNQLTGMDSIYVRDAAILSEAGVILCNMGKAARTGEPDACRIECEKQGLPIIGAITGSGRIEGGDTAWLNPKTLVVGRGYRTNDAGIQQLSLLLAPEVELITVPLPHWHGPDDVFHLMSMLSPIAENLLLVYSPLLPVAFRELLLDRGFTLVEVPPEEFESMACNVLNLAPDRCLMIEGNPITRARLELAGVEVITYVGEEISRKGCGGPTCLTRPLLREV